MSSENEAALFSRPFWVGIQIFTSIDVNLTLARPLRQHSCWR